MLKMMPKIDVGRYEERDRTNYLGYIQPADHSWILFIKLDGTPVLFANRDPATGECIGEGVTR